MCLRIKKDDKENFLPRVAKEDIECYKVLVKLDDNKYCTPYKKYKVNIKEVFKANTGKEYHDEYKNKYWNMPFPENALEGDILKYKPLLEYYLGPGMVHVFVSLGDARAAAMRIYNSTVWKCIIKKGTRYYTGCCDNNMESYGAEEIKIEKRIKRSCA